MEKKERKKDRKKLTQIHMEKKRTKKETYSKHIQKRARFQFKSIGLHRRSNKQRVTPVSAARYYIVLLVSHVLSRV